MAPKHEQEHLTHEKHIQYILPLTKQYIHVKHECTLTSDLTTPVLQVMCVLMFNVYYLQLSLHDE